MSINGSQDYYIPIYDTVPDSWKDAQGFFTEQLKKISEGVNVRDIALYIENETLTGGQFVPSTNDLTALRSVFRKTIDFGSLPNASTKSVAHGLSIDNRFTLVKLITAATDPSNFLSLSIPYASATLTDVIEINMDDTNINITTSKDYSSYTRCYVIIEFLKEI
jgi:hypothetical protein